VATSFQVTIDCADPGRLVGVGATWRNVVATEAVDHYAVVLQDPEGNEYCLH
jgi:hypothetical protein